MATHLPSVTHILCRNHIARSIKALDSINGVAIPVTERNKAATLFSHTANAYQMRNFTANMASLQRLSPRLHAYVLTRAPEKWARSHIEAQLFMQLTYSMPRLSASTQPTVTVIQCCIVTLCYR